MIRPRRRPSFSPSLQRAGRTRALAPGRPSSAGPLVAGASYAPTPALPPATTHPPPTAPSVHLYPKYQPQRPCPLLFTSTPTYLHSQFHNQPSAHPQAPNPNHDSHDSPPPGAYLLGVMPPELINTLGLKFPTIKRDPHYFLPTTGDRRALLENWVAACGAGVPFCGVRALPIAIVSHLACPQGTGHPKKQHECMTPHHI